MTEATKGALTTRSSIARYAPIHAIPAGPIVVTAPTPTLPSIAMMPVLVATPTAAVYTVITPSTTRAVVPSPPSSARGVTAAPAAARASPSPLRLRETPLKACILLSEPLDLNTASPTPPPACELQQQLPFVTLHVNCLACELPCL